jgi:DNA polymerase-4/DNA polymerase V
MPIFQVKKNFPKTLVLPGDYKSYLEYSSKVFEIVRRYAYGIEEYSIDECFADITGLNRTLKKSYLEIAQKIKNEIKDELHLSVSIGLAPNKVLAKVASTWNKPNGLTEITLESIHTFLPSVPIKKIWGIGSRTSELLIQHGIKTAMDFSLMDYAWVSRHLSKPYQVIWKELHGEKILHVNEVKKTVYASIQKTLTFHPITNNRTFLWSQLSKHTEDACRKARHYNLTPKKVSLFLKTSKHKILTHTFTLPIPSNSPEILLECMLSEFNTLLKKEILYRATGAVLHDLHKDSAVQNDLFGKTAKANSLDMIYKQIDSLERKFGKRMVHIASTYTARNHHEGGTHVDDLEHDLLFL